MVVNVTLTNNICMPAPSFQKFEYVISLSFIDKIDMCSRQITKLKEAMIQQKVMILRKKGISL